MHVNKKARYSFEDSNEEKDDAINERRKSEIKVIEDIFESKHQFIYEKTHKLNELLIKYQSQNDEIIKEIFDFKTLSTILNKIDQCTSAPQKELLNIVEYISNRISLYNDLESYEPIKKFNSLLRKKIIEDEKINKNEDYSFSLLTEQILRTYLNINRYKKHNENMLVLISIIIMRNIQALIKRIQIKEKDSIQKRNKEKNQDQNDNRIQSLTKTLDSFGKLLYNSDEQLTEIIKFQEIISPLIHFNCSEQFKCQQSIKVSLTPNLILLQSSAYEVLHSLSICEDIDKYFVKQENIFQHFQSIFDKFNDFHTFHNQIQKMNQQQQFSQPLIQITKTTTNFLFNFLLDNKYTSQQVRHNQNFINSLIQLNKYQLNKYINEQQTKDAQWIRYRSRVSLDSIRNYGDIQTMKLLTVGGYPNSLLLNLSSAGGLMNLNNQEIQSSLSELTQFIYDTIIGRDNEHDKKVPKFGQQLKLFRLIEEQIEIEGMNEEIEAQQQNQEFQWDEWEYQAKHYLQNVYIDSSNILQNEED